MVNGLDRLRDRRRLPGAIGGAPLDQVGLKKRRGVTGVFRAEPSAIRRMTDDRLGEVRAADRLAGVGAPRQHVVVEVEPQFPERLGHPCRPAAAVTAEILERGAELGLLVIDPVAEDVQVASVDVECRDFNPGHEADAGRGRGDASLGDAID